MEFEKIYKKAFNKSHLETENYIKGYLTKNENSIYKYSVISKLILEEYYKKVRENKFNSEDLWGNLIAAFEKGLQTIKTDPINNSFKLNVLPLFNNYKKDGSLNEDYSFEELIKETAIYNSKTKTYNIFRNHEKLFEMIYNSNDYSKFEIKDYNEVLENTEVYTYYNKLLHPHLYENNPEKNIIKNIPEIDIPENNLEYKLSLFEEDEKLLLLHALYYYIDKNKLENKNIDLTQFLRIIIICQGLNDLSIFEDNYMKKLYSRVNKGIEYSESSNYKKKLIENTLHKIKDLKIREIEDYIKGLR